MFNTFILETKPVIHVTAIPVPHNVDPNVDSINPALLPVESKPTVDLFPEYEYTNVDPNVDSINSALLPVENKPTVDLATDNALHPNVGIITPGLPPVSTPTVDMVPENGLHPVPVIMNDLYLVFSDLSSFRLNVL
ncbi:Uncharacterised protein g9335 [Pycnogonum litorale]